jgi:hypothetical protein
VANLFARVAINLTFALMDGPAHFDIKPRRPRCAVKSRTDARTTLLLGVCAREQRTESERERDLLVRGGPTIHNEEMSRPDNPQNTHFTPDAYLGPLLDKILSVRLNGISDIWPCKADAFNARARYIHCINASDALLRRQRGAKLRRTHAKLDII